MRLLVPQALWALSLAGVVLLFYILKKRRQKVTVASTLIWRQVLSDTTADTPWQRLRRNLFLILQLAAVVLGALALSRPIMRGTMQPARSLCLVVDTSASMQARTPDGRTRFEVAMAAARKLADSLRPGDRMMLIEAGPSCRLVSSLSGSRAAILSALKTLQPHDSDGTLAEAVTLASGALKDRPCPQIVLLSDGASPDAQAVRNRSSLIPVRHIMPEREGGANCAIVALQVRPDPKKQDGYFVFVLLRNYGERTARVTATIERAGSIVRARQVSVPPGARQTLLFEASLSEGPYVLRLDPPDGFALDDRAWFVIRRPKQLRVALVTSGNPFLEAAISSDRDVNFFATSADSESGFEGVDLAIFDRSVPKVALPCDLLVLDPPGDFGGFRVGDEINHPEIVDARADHSLTRFVDFSDLHVLRARKIKPPEGAQNLASAREAPLISTRLEGGIRTTAVAFDLGNSDWVLSPSFPIFLGNVLQDMRLRGGLATCVGNTGTPIRLRASTEPVIVRSPDGEKTTVKSGEGAVFSNTLRAGVYAVERGQERQLVALNLLNESESDIRPRALTGSENLQAAESILPTDVGIWWVFAMILFGVLVFEFAAYHRRFV